MKLNLAFFLAKTFLIVRSSKRNEKKCAEIENNLISSVVLSPVPFFSPLLCVASMNVSATKNVPRMINFLKKVHCQCRLFVFFLVSIFSCDFFPFRPVSCLKDVRLFNVMKLLTVNTVIKWRWKAQSHKFYFPFCLGTGNCFAVLLYSFSLNGQSVRHKN